MILPKFYGVVEASDRRPSPAGTITYQQTGTTMICSGEPTCTSPIAPLAAMDNPVDIGRTIDGETSPSLSPKCLTCPTRGLTLNWLAWHPPLVNPRAAAELVNRRRWAVRLNGQSHGLPCHGAVPTSSHPAFRAAMQPALRRPASGQVVKSQRRMLQALRGSSERRIIGCGRVPKTPGSLAYGRGHP